MEMGGDASASKDEGDRAMVVTSVEHHEPTAASVGGGRTTEMRGDVPESRKRTMSEDAGFEREAKRARSPRPSEASSASRPLAPSVVEQSSRSGGCDHSPAALGSASVRDPQRGDAPPVAMVVPP